MENISFGAIVQRERNQRDLSLAKLANMLEEKVDPSYINRLEKNEKVNPSFKIVAMLSDKLNLDLREVYRSFGFESLINGAEANSEFTIEQLFRLHKIKLQNGEVNSRKINRSWILDNEEKELLIQILYRIFEISLVDAVPNQTLANIVEEIHQFRELQQKILREKDTIEIEYLGKTFIFRIGSLEGEVRSLDEWRNVIFEMVENRGSKLLDIPRGTISLQNGEEHWLALKDGDIITFLAKQSEIIQL